MRNGETHFEQVPMAAIEKVLRQAAALARMLNESSAPVTAQERQAASEPQQESTRFKGRP
jgi:hypothetical protein